jgi:SAM-dependent methyltransferase
VKAPVAVPGDIPEGIEPGSFRDRSARVFYSNGSVYRGLTASAWQEWQSVSATAFFRRAVDTGHVVATEVAPSWCRESFLPADWVAVLRHQRIPFIAYPYEWCFGQLKDAALLQLELLSAALDEDIALKDATPFNIQYVGPQPVFIDVASFTRWRLGQPWAGYRQFCRMFLYPLLLQAYKAVPFHPWLRGRLDGIEAVDCRQLMSWRDMLRAGVLTHVFAQSRLERRFADTGRDIKRELQRAGFDKQIISANLAGLKKLVTSLRWTTDRSSVWAEYATHNSYDGDASIAKERFVQAALAAKRRRIVWDLGCNTGLFAKRAAGYADYVVAIDSDHESVERLYRDLQQSATRNVLPLVMDVSDPSPALGWRASERRALLDRGRPDLVLCLALIHHLAITSNIPVADLLDWFVELGGDLVIEFPTPEDPMVQRLLRNKEEPYADYCVEYFEDALGTRFDIRARLLLPSGTRVLYHATPRVSTAAHRPPSSELTPSSARTR